MLPYGRIPAASFTSRFFTATWKSASVPGLPPLHPCFTRNLSIPLKLVAFAAKNHPIAKKKELALSDLEHVPLIVRMDDDLQSTTHTVLNTLRKQGYKLNIAMRCESPEAVQSAVTQNLGIGLLYYHAVKPRSKEEVSREFRSVA
jgi:DNA-binding transcriptional LysR family regulator